MAQRFPIISGQVGLGPPIALLLVVPVAAAVTYWVEGASRSELPIWIGLAVAAELFALYVLIVAIGMKDKAVVVAEGSISIPRWWTWRPLILEWELIESFARERKLTELAGRRLDGPLHVTNDGIQTDEQLTFTYFGTRKVSITNAEVFAFDDLERAVRVELDKRKPAG